MNRSIEPWDALTDDEKRVYEKFQEVYAGFLTHTDAQIGRFLDSRENTGELDNTIIVFNFR